jgi:hypothetical protein
VLNGPTRLFRPAAGQARTDNQAAGLEGPARFPNRAWRAGPKTGRAARLAISTHEEDTAAPAHSHRHTGDGRRPPPTDENG